MWQHVVERQHAATIYVHAKPEKLRPSRGKIGIEVHPLKAKHCCSVSVFVAIVYKQKPVFNTCLHNRHLIHSRAMTDAPITFPYYP